MNHRDDQERQRETADNQERQQRERTTPLGTPLDSDLNPVLGVLGKLIERRSQHAAPGAAAGPPPPPSKAAMRVIGTLQRRRPKVPVRDEMIARSDGSALRVRVHDPFRRDRRPVIVHAHGGGFRIGDPESSDNHLAQFAARVGAVVVSVDYRLIPDHPFPAALDDILLAVRWVNEHASRLGVDPARLALTGGSAGGNLAMAAALAFPSDLPRPRLALLEEPWLDLSEIPEPPEAAGHFYRPFMGELELCRGQYAGGRSYDDPGISPGLAEDLRAMPTTVVLACDIDLLIGQQLRLVSRLRAQGVQASGYVFPGLVHGTGGLTRIGAAADLETVGIAVMRGELLGSQWTAGKGDAAG